MCVGERLRAETRLTAEGTRARCPQNQESSLWGHGAEKIFELDLEESADTSGDLMEEHSRGKACLQWLSDVG